MSNAAMIETFMSRLIAYRLSADAQSLDWLERYVIDRIPIADKIRLLGEIVSDLPDSVAYPEFLDDLRSINAARVHIAHSVVWPQLEQATYTVYRRGEPKGMLESEL